MYEYCQWFSSLKKVASYSICAIMMNLALTDKTFDKKVLKNKKNAHSKKCSIINLSTVIDKTS